jgi:hypothetical protein
MSRAISSHTPRFVRFAIRAFALTVVKVLATLADEAMDWRLPEWRRSPAPRRMSRQVNGQRGRDSPSMLKGSWWGAVRRGIQESSGGGWVPHRIDEREKTSKHRTRREPG